MLADGLLRRIKKTLHARLLIIRAKGLYLQKQHGLS